VARGRKDCGEREGRTVEKGISIKNGARGRGFYVGLKETAGDGRVLHARLPEKKVHCKPPPLTTTKANLNGWGRAKHRPAQRENFVAGKERPISQFSEKAPKFRLRRNSLREKGGPCSQNSLLRGGRGHRLLRERRYQDGRAGLIEPKAGG